jgi:hypothetical protein
VVLFFLTYLTLRRKRSERGKATQDFPAFAQAEGLQHQQRQPGEIGVLTGTYQGFELRVDPDEGAKIWLRFTHAPKVELRTFKFHKRQPAGMEPLLSSYQTFEGYFADRYVGPAVNELLSKLEEDLDAIVRDLKTAPHRVIALSITSEGIECRLQVERIAYISTDTLRYLLPRLVRLAKVFDVPEAAAGGAGDPDADDFAAHI